MEVFSEGAIILLRFGVCFVLTELFNCTKAREADGVCTGLEPQAGRGASPGQHACLTRALSPPRPADQQARGQGAAHLAAQHPAQGGEPGAQETEGWIPGVSCTSAPHSGAGFHFFCLRQSLYIFFLIMNLKQHLYV